jgi:hypothetical protein
MTPAHRVLFDKVDSIQATIDFIRITGGPFTGKMYRPDGRSCTSFTKFLINFRSVIFRAIAGLPAAMNAVSLTEAIFYELRPGDVNTDMTVARGAQPFLWKSAARLFNLLRGCFPGRGSLLRLGWILVSPWGTHA